MEVPFMNNGGEKMPPEIARARFAAAGNLDKMGDYGYAYGGDTPKYMQQGGQQDQIMMVIQQFAQMNQVDPQEVIQQLQQLPAEQQQAAIQKMAETIQQASQQQPDMVQAAMAYGGYTTGVFADGGEPDGSMALGQIDAAVDKLQKLRQFIQPESDLEPWVSSKLTKMDDYADAVSDYMMYNPEAQGEMMEEPQGLPMQQMKEGGIPTRYKNMGFSKVGAKKESTRPGKKWMVLAKKGSDYKVVHGGYDGMKDFSQHGSEKRKDRFWDRMGGKNSAKAKDPFSPLYWHKKFGTWQDGGELPTYQNGEQVMFPTMDPQAALKKAQELAAVYANMNVDYMNRMNADRYFDPKNIAKRFGKGFEDNLRSVQNKHLLEMLNKTAPQFSIDSKTGKLLLSEPFILKQKNGGYIPEYGMGGMPCYECGGMFAEGGMYDCPDQEKDPVTGKCKAEVVRGREANAANKAASADMNAWAKQVAAMDKEVAKQNAAQYAGQKSFDYDWMQSPVDKAEKKAAIAQYKQFIQQNPNVFVADDSSGYNPEQKYIIASKLKQKSSTPMGSKAFQQKFNQDARLLDLGRIQSDIVPLMGGWSGIQNWLFGNKKFGGYIGQDGKRHISKTPTWSGNTGYQEGGPVLGDVMDVTPEQLEVLRAQGYDFEII
jgi:hypothetical protein